jgi:molybdopterin molybdotransferase
MAVSINEAIDKIISNISPIEYELVPIENIVNRVSANNLQVSFSLPPYNNSAMDGYGVKLAQAGSKVKVIDTILAGDDKEINLNDNEVIKIMTGAKVPDCIEAIVPFEDAKIIDNEVILPTNIKSNQHIRFVGEDIKKDEILFGRGKELNFADITLLASQGISHIKVYRKPRVSVFTSGGELKLHFEQKAPYQIYNSNTPTMLVRLKELGCESVFVGMAKDNINSLKELISNSLPYDLIITSGGISVGEADFTKEAFSEFDMINFFEGISIKPGKPTVFGKVNHTYILNLPGNPLAASLIFELFGRIIIQKLKGSKDIYHNYILANLSEDLNIKPGRETIIPGFFDGEKFYPSSKRSPGMVGVLYKCNSFIITAKDVSKLNKNSKVKVLPINFNFFTSNKKDIFTYG